jgi:hypothetical protein
MATNKKYLKTNTHITISRYNDEEIIEGIEKNSKFSLDTVEIIDLHP